MEVVKVKTEDGKERYYVADKQGFPIEPVLKFIRFKDNTNYARNTLKMYCYHLKLYFEYLEQRGVDYQDITIDRKIVLRIGELLQETLQKAQEYEVSKYTKRT